MVGIGFGSIVVLVLLGVPVWVSVLLGSSVVLLASNFDSVLIGAIIYEKVANVALIAVPLFILSGQLLALGGAARPLINLLTRFMGHIPGGPAYAVIVASVIFAAMSSSGLAALAGFAPIVIPMMLQMGYSRRFSVGLLMCSSALGPLIPPSTYLIIFGFMTETSVKDLYTAAFIPGLTLAVLLGITVLFTPKEVTMSRHRRPPGRKDGKR